MTSPTLVSILPKLFPVLERQIRSYHTLFDLPLKAEWWEETLHRSLGKIGFSTTWLPDNSHQVGMDMSIPEIAKSRISCKSGAIINCQKLGKWCVNFNGSRTTKQKTLEEKIKYLSTSKDDYYFLLSRQKKQTPTVKEIRAKLKALGLPTKGKKSELQARLEAANPQSTCQSEPRHSYVIMVFPSSLVRPDQAIWEEKKDRKTGTKVTGWSGICKMDDDPRFCASITKSMSDQLWTTLSLSLVPHQFKITID